MSQTCTVSVISPFVCELTNKVTRDDLEKHFRSKAAVEAVAQAIVAISFVRICVALLEICPGEVFGTEVSFQSRYSTDHVYHFLPIGLHWSYVSILYLFQDAITCLYIVSVRNLKLPR